MADVRNDARYSALETARLSGARRHAAAAVLRAQGRRRGTFGDVVALRIGAIASSLTGAPEALVARDMLHRLGLAAAPALAHLRADVAARVLEEVEWGEDGPQRLRFRGHPFVVLDPAVGWGAVTIVGTRLAVEDVVNIMSSTPDVGEAQRHYPALSAQAVQDALAFAHAA